VTWRVTERKAASENPVPPVKTGKNSAPHKELRADQVNAATPVRKAQLNSPPESAGQRRLWRRFPC